MVNGEVVNIFFYILCVGDMVGVCEKFKFFEVIIGFLIVFVNKCYDWFDWNGVFFIGKVLSVFLCDMIFENIKE